MEDSNEDQVARDTIDALSSSIGPETPLNDRLAAMSELITHLPKSQLLNTASVWYRCRELLQPSFPLDARKRALELLIAFLSNSNITSGARLALYKDIVTTDHPQLLDLQLQALSALTSNGRNLNDLDCTDSVPLVDFLVSRLNRIYDQIQALRHSSDNSDALAQTMYTILDFLSNCCKYNARFFEEIHVQKVIMAVHHICCSTSSADDIEKCVSYFNTLIIYGALPVSQVHAILRVICAVPSLVPHLKDQMWLTVWHIADSPLGNHVITSLMQICNASDNFEPNLKTIAGAVELLQRLLENTDVSTNYLLDFSSVFISYRAAGNFTSTTITMQIARSTMALISQPKIVQKTLFNDWTSDHSPFAILFDCAAWLTPQLVERNPFPLFQSPVKVHFNVSESDAPDKVKPDIQDPEKASEIKNILVQAISVCKDLYSDPKFRGPLYSIVRYLISFPKLLDPECCRIIIDYYTVENLCNPLSVHWNENLQTLINIFVRRNSFDRDVTAACFTLVTEVAAVAAEITDEKMLSDLLKLLYKDCYTHVNKSALEFLLNFAEESALKVSLGPFELITSNLARCITQELLEGDISSALSDLQNLSVMSGDDESSADEKPEEFVEKDYSQLSRSTLIVRTLGRIFLTCLPVDGTKAALIYKLLVLIVQPHNTDIQSKTYALRLLFNLRSTSSGNVYVINPRDIEGFSTVIGRYNANLADSWTTETRNPHTIHKSIVTWYEPQKIVDLFGINVGDTTEPSRFLTIEAPSSSNGAADDSTILMFRDRYCSIDMNIWFSTVISLLENSFDWDTYSYALTHFSPQMNNMVMFKNSIHIVRRIRQAICHQLAMKDMKISLPSNVTRSDIQLGLLQTINSLLSYHDFYTKAEQDDIVRVVVMQLNSWEKITTSSINILALCSYEIPLSIKKFLPSIITQLQMKANTYVAGAQVVEFLATISRVPYLTNNCTMEDYKRIFGLSFKFLQSAQDIEQLSRYSGPEYDSRVINYLEVMAYNVIAVWFLALRLDDRKAMLSFIMKNLTMDKSIKSMDNLAWCFVDFIVRFAFSDMPLSVGKSSPSETLVYTAKQYNSEVISKTWVYGTSVIQIETVANTGVSEITVRRATGANTYVVTPEEVPINSDTSELVLPGHLLMQLVVPETLSEHEKPILVPDDPQNKRAVGILGRMPAIALHKIGVIYIGPGQKDEGEYLKNSVGSSSYVKFAQGLGDLVKLQGNRDIYTGGLDTEADYDGKYTYVWRDQITEVVFHITTMMPFYEHDPAASNKKRHIGNDFVNIYYNDSGEIFNSEFELKSQFNFINIIISPHSVLSNTEDNLILEDFQDQSIANKTESTDDAPQIGNAEYFRVRVSVSPHLPKWSVATDLKVVSAKSLSLFVRNLALNASILALVWNSGESAAVSWIPRLQQIVALRERCLTQQSAPESHSETSDKDVSVKSTKPDSEPADKADTLIANAAQILANARNLGSYSEDSRSRVESAESEETHKVQQIDSTLKQVAFYEYT
ncbi:hypothetical protein CANCADRAFT_29916 [Tortispora caseinolytica NRRL Y-17796]|uniref:Rap-GAP domain-containing protein n=1 Tax=Tortispora caseinolytica NRRL Y-17796 TaxID=767744 RepID=A0A1E4TIE1_9ASCO|nr:hypothetical protein CANCADRAFT_29916 [Tortispora caseinolytica NRRL Y-17796]